MRVFRREDGIAKVEERMAKQEESIVNSIAKQERSIDRLERSLAQHLEMYEIARSHVISLIFLLFATLFSCLSSALT